MLVGEEAVLVERRQCWLRGGSVGWRGGSVG